MEDLDACAVLSAASTTSAAPQGRPVMVVVGGQPRAGKTKIADLVQAAFGQRGGAVRVGRDLYKAAHRHYAVALATDVRTEGAKVRPDTSRWQTAVGKYVRDHGLDTVVESAPPACSHGGERRALCPRAAGVAVGRDEDFEFLAERGDEDETGCVLRGGLPAADAAGGAGRRVTVRGGRCRCCCRRPPWCSAWRQVGRGGPAWWRR